MVVLIFPSKVPHWAELQQKWGVNGDFWVKRGISYLQCCSSQRGIKSSQSAARCPACLGVTERKEVTESREEEKRETPTHGMFIWYFLPISILPTLLPSILSLSQNRSQRWSLCLYFSSHVEWCSSSRFPTCKTKTSNAVVDSGSASVPRAGLCSLWERK